MTRRDCFPYGLAALVVALSAGLWAVGHAGPEKPKAIPIPIYEIKTSYSGTGKELIETRRVVCTNMPADAAQTWKRDQTPPLHVVYQGGDFYFFPWKGGPSPGPEPKPDPPPPPPITKLFGVIIVEETKDRTPQQAAVQDAIHKACDGKKLQWARLDKDVVDENGKPPADMAAWLAKAKGKTLPYLILVGENGIVAWEGTQPATEAAALELLKKYGG